MVPDLTFYTRLTLYISKLSLKVVRPVRVYNNYVSIIIATVFIDLEQNHGLPLLQKFSNQEAVLNKSILISHINYLYEPKLQPNYFYLIAQQTPRC